MGAMKSSIQMEAAGRVGADTRIPYPREDYGLSKLAEEQRDSQPDSLLPTGQQKVSSDWEELDLRSNSPSATSVQECAKLKLFGSKRDGRGLRMKEVSSCSEQTSGAASKDKVAASRSVICQSLQALC